MSALARLALLLSALALVSGCSDGSASSTPATGGDDVSLPPTPSQQEGPYYPVTKPADRDSDLTTIDGGSGIASGEVLVVGGTLTDTTGLPIEGAVIEIWQTERNGVYLHPSDPAVDDRDANFQGYGESLTDTNGAWGFRTINPGYYEPRPRHIHVKVLVDDVVVLTTQIYFSDDPDSAGIAPALVASVETDTDGTLTANQALVVSI